MTVENKKTGYVYITEEGNVGFDFDDFHFEITGNYLLSKIERVVAFDPEETFIKIKTNYGAKCYYLDESLRDVFVNDCVDIESVLEGFDTIEIKYDGLPKGVKVRENDGCGKEFIEKAFLIINNIAFFKVKRRDDYVLQVKDLDNPKYFAEYLPKGRLLHMLHSSFPEGERKYETFFLVEHYSRKLCELLADDELAASFTSDGPIFV